MIGNPMQRPTQPPPLPTQPPTQPPRTGDVRLPTGARIAIFLVVLLILALVVYQAQPGAVLGAREASSCGAAPSFNSAPREDAITEGQGALFEVELPHHSAISVGDPANFASYSVQTTHVCTPYSSPLAVSTYFSLSMPASAGWVSSGQFPFNGSQPSACGGPCWQTSGPGLISYLALQHMQQVGTVAVYDIVEAQQSQSSS